MCHVPQPSPQTSPGWGRGQVFRVKTASLTPPNQSLDNIIYINTIIAPLESTHRVMNTREIWAYNLMANYFRNDPECLRCFGTEGLIKLLGVLLHNTDTRSLVVMHDFLLHSGAHTHYPQYCYSCPTQTISWANHGLAPAPAVANDMLDTPRNACRRAASGGGRACRCNRVAHAIHAQSQSMRPR